MHPQLHIAYFITPHGFGHAARASAVMNAIYRRWPFVFFDIFTQTPAWFFENGLCAPFAWHAETTDIGLSQTSPFSFDADKTIADLAGFLPFPESRLSRLRDALIQAECRLVICDISPLGIIAARSADLPSALVENFTWDWIYAHYLEEERRFEPYIRQLAEIYELADLRYQAEPVCREHTRRLLVPPVAREPKSERVTARRQLGIDGDGPLVLVTMGGIAGARPETRHYRNYPEVVFVMPSDAPDLPDHGRMEENRLLLPHRSSLYHPDIMGAADAVIGKAGYSTVAEAYRAGVPFGYILRSDFRESPVLEAFIQNHMPGLKIPEADYASGRWLGRLPALLAMPRAKVETQNGAEVIAEDICCFLADRLQLLDIVDGDGRIVGAAPRRCVHGDNRLLHRVVHVLVFDAGGRLLLQKRSAQKKVAPGRWDTSVGGHVDCGESIEEAMRREMSEELGVSGISPRFAYRYQHSNDLESELVFTYWCVYDGPIRFSEDEIDLVKFWEMEEIESAMGQGILSDNFEDEFRRYQTWAGDRFFDNRA